MSATEQFGADAGVVADLRDDVDVQRLLDGPAVVVALVARRDDHAGQAPAGIGVGPYRAELGGDGLRGVVGGADVFQVVASDDDDEIGAPDQRQRRVRGVERAAVHEDVHRPSLDDHGRQDLGQRFPEH